MFSWWGNTEPVVEVKRPNRRTVITKQVHVEVIGGSSTSARWDSRQPSTSRIYQPQRKSVAVVGSPKLPLELITYILLIAAELLLQSEGESSSLLRLASVDRSAHHAIVTSHILPDLRLSGVFQVERFAQDLRNNVLGLQHQVKRVKRLTIRRGGGDRTTLEFIQAVSLFSGVEEMAYFEKMTLEPLRDILSHCTSLEHLSLDMPASVLDERNRKEPKARVGTSLGSSLKELVTLLSVYGGDLNEALWHPGIRPFPRWNNLTHLQLHGPRFRLDARAAIAISRLPSLSHLALIMPILIQPNTTSEYPYNSIDGFKIDNAKDALGRCNVLQILIDSLGSQLQKLLLICHDVENYVGNVQRLGSWFRTLHWRCNTTMEEMGDRKGAKLVLVTAKPWNTLQTSPHPSLYSKWMLQRAERGMHWNWNERDNFVGHDICEQMDLSYSVESWTIPIVFQRSPSSEEYYLENIQERLGLQRETEDAETRPTEMNHEEHDTSSESLSLSSSSDGVSGIDNLD
ncbi:hypothetical protein CBS101457_001936 [Exobasidium rhododendri]|nr:hypothetical protein CBS101457_001936 [Exobasidium rhododendri]